MPKQNTHFRCTLPEYYEQGSPGHEHLSGRQGHYVTAPTAREAAKEIYRRTHWDPRKGCGIHYDCHPDTQCCVDVQIWCVGHRAHGKKVASVWLSFCGKCDEPKEDVQQRYSYGVYAGVMCRDCCSGYRDRCGLDGDQGDYRELVEMGENYWEED